MDGFRISISVYGKTRQWRHNERDGVSDHQPHDCLLKRLFRGRSKKTSKLCVTGLCGGNSPVTGEFPAQRASNAENVSIWWHHHESDFDDYVLTWKRFLHHWPIAKGIHQSPTDSPHGGSVMRGGDVLMLLTWTNYWTKYRLVDDLERYDSHVKMKYNRWEWGPLLNFNAEENQLQ